jgi:hypothetical protein
MNVQHYLEPGSEGYDAVHCPACARLHFVDRKTRTLLGDPGKKAE